MREELEKQLFEKYPKIFRQKDLPMNQTCMCWGIDTGDGWYNIIDTLCNDIQFYVDNEKIPQVEAVQVKEKFGGLRFYINGCDDYIRGLVNMAESMSYKTCDNCGNAGKPNKDGWIRVLCESCRNKNK